MEGGDDGGAAAAAAAAAVDSKDLQQQSKALDKLTDRVEDRQLDSSRVQSVRKPKSFSLFLYFCYILFSLYKKERNHRRWIFFAPFDSLSYGSSFLVMMFGC